MIGHTNAFTRYKAQGEAMFNFVVVACDSMPSLRAQIEAIKADTTTAPLPSPDYFKGNTDTLDALLLRCVGYTKPLASYVLLSSFSYFEAYVSDTIGEMIQFHGDVEKLERRSRTFITSTPPDVLAHKRKLQEPIKPAKLLKYRKHTKALVSAGYQFPSNLLSSYGARILERKLDNLKAFEIPDLLKEGLHMNLSRATITRFTEIRSMRNTVAHGNPVVLELRTAMQASKDLHKLAAQVDI